MVNTASHPVFEQEVESLTPPILLQYWAMTLRWKFAIISIIIGALTLGVIFTLLATPKYTAVSQIEISREQKNVTNVEGLESAESSRDAEFYQTQYTLLTARSLAERTARSLNLIGNRDFLDAYGLSEKAPFTADVVDRDAQMRTVLGILLRDVKITPITRSRLVNIEYTSPSPTVSAQIANAWSQQFIQASMDRRFASTADARKFLEGRLSGLARKLEESERTSVNFASDRGIVTLTGGRNADGKTETGQTLVSADLSALNNALAQATADRIAAEARTRINAGGVTADALTNSTIASIRQQRAQTASEYARLLAQFEPGYPPARALSEQIRSLDGAIAREEARVGQGRSTAYNEAVAREQALKVKVDELTTRLSRQSRDSIQYNIYQRDADTNRQLYDSLLQRYKEIGVAGVAANNIVIVDIAQVPRSPSAPSLSRNLLVALIIGLGLSVVTVLVLEQIDEGLREPGDVRRQLQLPLLGSIPKQDTLSPLDALRDAKSEVSEAYLTVQSNLAFSTDHGVPRSLMVTSTRPGEGKSTSALAIATVLARTGRKVLLIDGDMRSPSVHVFTGGSNQVGLSNYLAGDDQWEGFISHDGPLAIMTAGPTPPSAAELFSSDRLSMLIGKVLDHYDNVVIDSPPLLGLADGPLISRSVEGVVFVVESGGIAVRGLRSALSRLHLIQAHIVGVILTKLSQRNAGYGYGYGYGDGYGANTDAKR